MALEVSFDFRSDAGGESADPDASSPMLLRYHHLLWNKPLPSGKPFVLTPSKTKPYALLHDSELGTFHLTSDTAFPTFTPRPGAQSIIDHLPPADVEAFVTITRTIGGMVLWPGNQINRMWTINQARGCTKAIADRLDLTVECVRRHYEDDVTHPLGPTFDRYRDVFDLFETFAGYVDFWLLDDLVDANGDVKLFLSSENSTRPSTPQTVADYLTYCERTVEFVMARNERIHHLGL